MIIWNIFLHEATSRQAMKIFSTLLGSIKTPNRAKKRRRNLSISPFAKKFKPKPRVDLTNPKPPCNQADKLKGV